MNVRWDWLERATWIIGILAALIAVPAAWATLRGLSLQVADINERENRKVAEEWKTGTIYGILTEEKAGILPFPAIRERYTIAATREHKQGVEINLSDGELRQILISLMNARAVVYFGDGQYGPAVEVGQWTPQSELVWLCGGMNPGAQPQVGPATACSDSSGGFRQQLARHVALGLVVLAREHAPVPLDTFQSKLLNEGGDKDFLQQNEQIVLDQMVYLKQVKMTADGLIMSSVRGPPVPASPTAEAPSPFPGKRPSGLTKRNQ